ncbi:MAG: cryptochrome/photolyase family protein, partial [Rhodothermales bacterium]|nr:cryptochrome/photolyase family protein [Rhodothermales bacterium]
MSTLYLLQPDCLDAAASWISDVRDDDTLFMTEFDRFVAGPDWHIQRVILYLSAMRRFRARLENRLSDSDAEFVYEEIGSNEEAKEAGTSDPSDRLLSRLEASDPPARIATVRPASHEALSRIRNLADDVGAEFELLPDARFLCTLDEFGAWREGRKRLVMEYFYREMRKKTGLMMEPEGPAGGEWNFDDRNRRSVPDDEAVSAPEFGVSPTDEVTTEVLDRVGAWFPSNPGSAERFDWPTGPQQAEKALRSFVGDRLAKFGPYQDALHTASGRLFHSGLATSINLGLLDPLDACSAVEEAWRDGRVPISSAEGFIRQVIGWREFMRGVYWTEGADFMELNALDAGRDLPASFWTAETDMACVRHVVSGLLETGYAHHIQRLMVTGLLAMLHGTRPQTVHDWYMHLYADSAEWVTAPNTIGMSQFADGGVVGTKPYAASGKY